MNTDTLIYIPNERLAHFAENTARELKGARDGSMRGSARRLEDSLRSFSRDCARISARAETEALSPAGEWLLDNRWLALGEGRAALAAMRGAAGLPVCEGEPRALLLARALLRSGLGGLDMERLEIFLSAAQLAGPFLEKELAMFPDFLRAAAAERLADVAGEALNDNSDAHRLEAQCRALFGALRFLSREDLSKLLRRQSAVEQTLRRDPAGVYAKMDEYSRNYYRRELSRHAKALGMSDAEAARLCLALAEKSRGRRNHVGYYILENPLGRGEKRPSVSAYILPPLLAALVLSLLAGFLTENPFAFLLLLPTFWEAMKNLADYVVLRTREPRVLPRLALTRGVPVEGKTLCVVSVLLTDPDSAVKYVKSLEEYRILNRDCGKNLLFGLLADLPDSPTREAAGDAETLAAARREIERLDAKYGGFRLYARERSFNERDGVWTGRERKRGAIEELAAVLGEDVKFLITLDSDTRLCLGSARRLIGAALHPLNRFMICGKRVYGHAVLQPRVICGLEAADRNRFSRIFAGPGGIDPYSALSPEVYQDIFGRGSFTGKGLIDLRAYRERLAGRLPRGKILSHDLPEGEILRAGSMSDVCLTDGFPRTVASYYTRLDRWTRGDWQNLTLLRASGRAAGKARGDGDTLYNSIKFDALSKWKLFDNLRRSLTPSFTLAALAAGIFSGRAVLAAAALAALACFLSELALCSFKPGQRLRSDLVLGARGVFLRLFLQLLLLPLTVFVTLRAILRAIIRLKTGRRLLDWVTASQGDRAASGLPRYLRLMWPACAFGAICALLSPFPLGAAAGVVWLLSPLCCLWLDGGEVKKPAVSAENAAFLRSEAEKMWLYFKDNLNPRDNWLIPDNLQAAPSRGLARRSSPTNIGLALLSVVSAADLGFCGTDELFSISENVISSIERLEKWKGHLYNWYSTATARPLSPRVVSSVDSGNLAACLLCAGEAFAERGAEGLAARCRALWRRMDFSALYDRRRGQFHISFDADADRLSEGRYDLLESEARLTLYLCAATGQAEPRCWRAPGRPLAEYRGYRGMASWTGTMFEYLMPEIFLPLPRGGALWESARFCMTAQMGLHEPWGVSESSFALLDENLNYRYKANGVQALGLRRGLDDLVISPYSSYLALSVLPREAVKNLRKIASLDAGGRYGLFEALDFTPSRLCGDAPFETVSCWMAHHLGMSVCSVNNLLNDGILSRRFMREPETAAFSELLCERVPVDAPVSRLPASGRPPEKPRRRQESFTRSVFYRSEARPACALCGNGSVSMLLTDAGLCEISRGDISLLRCEPERGIYGMEFEFKFAGNTLSPLPAPGFDAETEYSCTLSEGAEYRARRGGLSARVNVYTLNSADCVLWDIELKNDGNEELRGELCCRFEPVVSKTADFEAHPAFSRLFLARAEDADGVTFTRKGVGSCRFAGTTENGALKFSETENSQYIIVSLKAAAKGVCGFRLCAAFDGEAEAAARLARRALKGEGGAAARGAACARALEMSANDVGWALNMLSCLTFPGPAAAPCARETLWRYGISGDWPLAAARVREGFDENSLCKLIKSYLWLVLCSRRLELAIILDENAGYSRPLYDSVMRLLRRLGCERRLELPCGIRLVPDGADAEAILGFASFVLGETPPERPVKRRYKRLAGDLNDDKPLTEYLESGEWRFTIQGRPFVPARSHMLSNPLFGGVFTECGCFGLWCLNARENRILPYINEPGSHRGAQSLRLRLAVGEAGLFAENDGFKCAVTFGFGYARWEKEFSGFTARLTAFVPINVNALVYILEAPEGRPVLEQDIILGPGSRPSRGVMAEQRGTFVRYVNYFDTDFSPQWAVVRVPEAIEGGVAVIITGRASSAEEEEKILALSAPDAARKALKETQKYWSELVGRVKIETQWPEFDRYVNGWSVYQSVACRIYGRCSLYQCGGAYGFRDQLQDVCNMLPVEPELARAQILRACSRQFLEGDAAHWWHELAGGRARGVRTRCSDDLLWLPWALCEYCEATGDYGFARENVYYLEAPPLEHDESERYAELFPSKVSESVFEHARRAALCALGRGTGERGLMKFLGGDWNDGMNRVGEAGRGESVWLTFFASMTLRRLAALCERLGEDVARFQTASDELLSAARAVFSGEIFPRGWYDDGEIIEVTDAISQGFAALAGAPEANIAVKNAAEVLFDRKIGIIKLFSPPFSPEGRDAGYICRYPPGVRENGGQYTHGAVWLALGALECGETELGREMLLALLPGEKNGRPAEPHVLCADVSMYGDAGWSWYTGAAGWYFRAATSGLLGLQTRDGRFFIKDPKAPGRVIVHGKFIDGGGLR